MSSLLILTYFSPSADESKLPEHVQQYLRDTQVRKHFIYETLRPSKARTRLDGTAAAAREFCLLAVRSTMVENEEHTFHPNQNIMG